LTKEAPYKGPGADSEEKREPVSDIDIAVADSLKVLDLKRPIREATEALLCSEMTRRANSGLLDSAALGLGVRLALVAHHRR
jgi:hypothetical protein